MTMWINGTEYVAVVGGTIDGTTIGATTPAAGSFTTLNASSTLTVTGAQSLFDRNTAALPGIAFRDDTNTGMRGAGGDVLYLVTGGTTALAIGAAADVGMAATKKLYFDGVAMTGDTYITESSANVLDLYAGAAKQLSLTPTGATVAGNLIVSGVGPHAIGASASTRRQLSVGGSFSASTGTSASSVLFGCALTGGAGHTSYLATWASDSTITTQASETVGTVATIYVVEPQVTVGSAGAVNRAASVYVHNAPTEGAINAAIYVAGGASMFQDTCYIGDTANANATLGLTINQGAADNQIAAFKSSDIATVLTSATTQAVETDDFATFSKTSATIGGLLVQSLAEDAALTNVTRIASYGGTADTTKTTAGRALIELYASEHNGANALADITADGNVFGVLARRGGADVALLLLDEDADLWLGGALACQAITSNGGLQTFLANDSAGAGFRYVVVPNSV